MTRATPLLAVTRNYREGRSDATLLPVEQKPEHKQEAPFIPEVSGLHLIGSGGFAAVYSGVQDRLSRRVAVKVFRASALDRFARQQFDAECRAVGALPPELGVVQVYSSGLVPGRGQPYLVMELCQGSLDELIAGRGPLAAHEVASVGYRLAIALAGVHRAGLLHRDVTPRNVLFRQSGQPVLADFGLSLKAEESGAHQEHATWVHAAPETWNGSASTRSDIYGLGSTLYTALAGVPAFAQRLGETDLAYRARVLTEPVPVIQDRAVPTELVALLARMMAKGPQDRPADADDVATALAVFCSEQQRAQAGPLSDEFASRTGVRASANRSAADAARLSAFEGTTKARTRPDRSPETRSRSRRWLIIGVISLGVVVAAGTALWVWPPTPIPTPTVTTGNPLPRVVLQVTDKGNTVELSWTGAPGLDYAVVTARAGEQANKPVLVHRTTAYIVSVDPTVQYCFSVQGTNGQYVVESDAVGIRGATCRR